MKKISGFLFLAMIAFASSAFAQQLTCYNQRMGYYPCPPEIYGQVGVPFPPNRAVQYPRQESNVNVYVQIPPRNNRNYGDRSDSNYYNRNNSSQYRDRSYGNREYDSYNRNQNYRNGRNYQTTYRDGYIHYDIYGRRIGIRGGFSWGRRSNRDSYEYPNDYNYRRNSPYNTGDCRAYPIDWCVSHGFYPR